MTSHLPGIPLSETAQDISHLASDGSFVVLCNPGGDRRSWLAGLSGKLPVVEESSLDRLAGYRQTAMPIAVIVPLDGPNDESLTETCRLIRAHRHDFRIIVHAHTSRLPIGVCARALAAGACKLFNEAAPAFSQELCRYLLQLAEEHDAQFEEQKKLGVLFETCGLIGQSPGLREVMRRAWKASRFSNLPVLLGGETGTGKQRVAEAIHALDAARRDKPFLTVNCGAINKNLAEAELFGHVRGAFSGADGARAGWFRAAEGGTLFLDEIGELDLELQPKLLRLLQDQRLLPVGADREQAVNVRVLAASNRKLKDMVSAGTFREDLYQRLAVFQIHVPALRERPEDIEPQLRHFLRLHRVGDRQEAIDVDAVVVQALRTLPWEGNTRQLENLVREILAFKERGSVVELEDLPVWVLERLAQPMGTPTFQPPPVNAGGSLVEAVEDYERVRLQSSLTRNHGNRTRTASELGLTPRTLYNKIKKYKLDSLVSAIHQKVSAQ